jgi:methyl-accepting chemotaxis protein-1 (serine sensor receptor)
MHGTVTIKSRLVFVISFLSLLLIAGGAVGLGSLHRTNDSLKTLYESRLIPVGQLDIIVRNIDRDRMAVAEAINNDPAFIAKRVEDIKRRGAEVARILDAYLASDMAAQEKALATAFAESYRKFVAEGLQPAVGALTAQNSQQAMEMMQGPMSQHYTPMQEGIDALIKLQLDIAKQEFEQGQQLYALVRNVCFAGIAFGLLLAGLVGAWVIRGVTRPLGEAVTLAQGVAAGDLTQHIEVRTQDETGQLLSALRDMNDSLAHTVGQVRAGTETIAVASREIASGNADLSARTEEQASALEKTASAMEQLTGTVRQNADNARQANQLVVAASGYAVQGGEVVGEVVNTMGSIRESSRRIADIIGVIDGIAFQTNILALNAAVEAARAGEQGRGFAVVASEVRNLAQRSANAAKEIKVLIGDSVDKVEQGGRLVDRAGKTMDDIVNSVRHVADIMAEITAASDEQSAGIEDIHRAIAQMDRMTQQNAALVEEAAAAALSMQEQAQALAQSVAVFKLSQSSSGDGRVMPEQQPQLLPRTASADDVPQARVLRLRQV